MTEQLVGPPTGEQGRRMQACKLPLNDDDNDDDDGVERMCRRVEPSNYIHHHHHHLKAIYMLACICLVPLLVPIQAALS